MDKRNVIILILCVALLGGALYYRNQLIKARLSTKQEEKEQLIQQQKERLKNVNILLQKLKDSLEVERNKPPIIIPKYNEKIIYITVSDSSIINTFTRERRNYLQKRQ